MPSNSHFFFFTLQQLQQSFPFVLFFFFLCASFCLYSLQHESISAYHRASSCPSTDVSKGELLVGYQTPRHRLTEYLQLYRILQGARGIVVVDIFTSKTVLIFAQYLSPPVVVHLVLTRPWSHANYLKQDGRESGGK